MRTLRSTPRQADMAEEGEDFIDAQDENSAGEGLSTNAPGALPIRTPTALNPIQQNAELLQELIMKSTLGISKAQLKDYSEQL